MCRQSRVNRHVVMVDKSSSATAVAQVGLATSSKNFHNFSQSGPPPVLNNNLCHNMSHNPNRVKKSAPKIPLLRSVSPYMFLQTP
jgi:hypothetical protein